MANDNALYELLALVDAIRDGRARERELAVAELTARIINLDAFQRGQPANQDK